MAVLKKVKEKFVDRERWKMLAKRSGSIPQFEQEVCFVVVVERLTDIFLFFSYSIQEVLVLPQIR